MHSSPPEGGVFISYAGPADSGLVRMAADLQAALGREVFLDVVSLRSGSLPDQVREALSGASTMIAVLSADWFQSEWCLAELSCFARAAVAAGREPTVVPLEIEDCEEFRVAKARSVTGLQQPQMETTFWTAADFLAAFPALGHSSSVVADLVERIPLRSTPVSRTTRLFAARLLCTSDRWQPKALIRIDKDRGWAKEIRGAGRDHVAVVCDSVPMDDLVLPPGLGLLGMPGVMVTVKRPLQLAPGHSVIGLQIQASSKLAVRIVLPGGSHQEPTVVLGCTVMAPSGTGILAKAGTDARVLGCEVATRGIGVHSVGRALTVVGTEFSGGSIGVDAECGTTSIRDCRISGAAFGIVVRKGAVVWSDNRLSECRDHAVGIYQGAIASSYGNVVKHCDTGVLVSGACHFVRDHLQGCRVGIEEKVDSTVTLDGVLFRDCQQQRVRG